MMLLFGAPGVGKGTQADILAEKYQLRKFSMGDSLREEVSLGGLLGSKIEGHIQNGELVPDELITEIVRNFLIENKDQHIIFDGFPRNLNQAMMLERLLAQSGGMVDLAIELQLDDSEIVRRLKNRWNCPSCGMIYNYLTHPPKKEGICDRCGAVLTKRVDDDEAVIRRRLKVYLDQTKPMTDYYRSLGVYRRIDAVGSKDEVFRKITEILDGYTDKR
jgi:adenylate kinase